MSNTSYSRPKKETSRQMTGVHTNNGCLGPVEVRLIRSGQQRSVNVIDLGCASLLWHHGMTTTEIAGMMRLTEAAVYNNLDDIRMLAREGGGL